MRKLLAAVLIIVALAAGAVLAWNSAKNKGDENPLTTTECTNQTSSQLESEVSSSDPNEEVSREIIYTDNGFETADITVKVGELIKVSNNSSSDLDFASDNHPTHEDNSDLNLGDIEPCESQTFMISEKGEWGYHNHDNDNHTGTITVQ